MSTSLHIDSDSMVYQVGFACEEKDGTVAPTSHVLHSVKEKVHKIIDRFPGAEYHLYLTDGPSNFRLDLYPEYKANRKQPKPKLYHIIRDYLEEKWGAVVIEGMEADDAVAMALHKDSEAICVSGDKDLWTVAGKHLNPRKLEEGVEDVSEADALKAFYTQLLTGDKVDNIPGAPPLDEDLREKYSVAKRKGIGPKTAEIILDGVETEAEMFERVRECYMDDEQMLLHGRLLHMTRELDEEGKPVLWSFPEEAE